MTAEAPPAPHRPSAVEMFAATVSPVVMIVVPAGILLGIVATSTWMQTLAIVLIIVGTNEWSVARRFWLHEMEEKEAQREILRIQADAYAGQVVAARDDFRTEMEKTRQVFEGLASSYDMTRAEMRKLRDTHAKVEEIAAGVEILKRRVGEA